MVYACGVFGNAGNYKGMGDTKFIPNLDFDKFEAIVTSCKAYQTSNKELTHVWSNCKKQIYNLTPSNKSLGFGPEGITTYFSENCTQKDSDLVNDWLKMKKMDAYNCRTFKTIRDNHTTYEIRLASILDENPRNDERYEDEFNEEGESPVTIPPEEYKGSTFTVTRGDYSELLRWVNYYLLIARKHTANDEQHQMIADYAKSFRRGCLEAHKDGSR